MTVSTRGERHCEVCGTKLSILGGQRDLLVECSVCGTGDYSETMLMREYTIDKETWKRVIEIKRIIDKEDVPPDILIDPPFEIFEEFSELWDAIAKRYGFKLMDSEVADWERGIVRAEPITEDEQELPS